MRLQGKVAIVTGGGTGIGRAITLRFAQEGARVAIAGRRPAPLEQTARAIVATGAEVIAIPGDVTRSGDVARLIAHTVETFGRLDVLVNNAGSIVSRTAVAECPDEAWASTLESNLTSVFRCAKAALAELARVRGVMVNIASIAGLKGSPSLAAYAAAKAGLINLTKSLALDYAHVGVRINVICPGYIETDLNRDMLVALRETGAYAGLVARHPLGLGSPEDVASAAVYLASDEARWVTGVALPVDGGFMAGL